MPAPALPQPVQQLIDALARLPGIGPKSASRLTYYLLRAPQEDSLALAEALRDLKAKTRFCQVCFNITQESPCAICANEQRDRSLICVVEEPLDVIALERTREYIGLYHVLHGALNPLEGVGPDELGIAALEKRVAQGVREVIVATNATAEGEATAMYLSRKLAELGAEVTRIAHGVPMGGGLEFSDDVTLGHAIEGRRKI